MIEVGTAHGRNTGGFSKGWSRPDTQECDRQQENGFMRHNQNRRSRGRSRKGPNPLARSYESNGPDVKVRGTAAHVAEKYISLARDAQVSGDIIAAENYLQHAEHYGRIVMAAQAQFQQSQPQFRENSDDAYDDDRQGNGRLRDRFEYNGDGRNAGDEDDEDRIEAGDEDDERGGVRPRNQRDEHDRPQSPRPDHYQYRERNARNDRPAEPDDRPERAPPAEDNAATDAAPAQRPGPDAQPDSPRRRRGRPRAAEGGEDEAQGGDVTPDGAAALAAFRE